MNKSQVIRDLIIFGFNYYADYGSLNKTTEELNAIGKNINQIEANANKTNSIFKSAPQRTRKTSDPQPKAFSTTFSFTLAARSALNRGRPAPPNKPE